MTDDLISRQAVLDLFQDNVSTLHNYARVWEAVEEMPSVTPTQNCVGNALGALDCISRQAAIEAVKQAIYNHDSAIMRLTELPSVNPQEPKVGE